MREILPDGRSTSALRGSSWALQVAIGLALSSLAVLVAAATQAGVTSSASLGGMIPTATSIELLLVMISVLTVGSVFLARGLAWFIEHTSYTLGRQAPFVPRSGLLGVFGAVLGVGLLVMGLLIASPFFCTTQDGPCSLSPGLMQVPNMIDAVGVVLLVASVLGMGVLRSRRARAINSMA